MLISLTNHIDKVFATDKKRDIFAIEILWKDLDACNHGKKC